jgi:hypothetical protein
MVVSFSRRKLQKGRDRWITLSKLTPAKREFYDPATDGLRSRVLSPMGGFLEEEIKVILINGGGR